MKITIDFNFPFYNLNGEIADDGRLASDVLASTLYVKAEPFAPIKGRDLAIELKKTHTLILDKEDANLLEKHIGLVKFPTFVEAGLLEVISDARSRSNTPAKKKVEEKKVESKEYV